MTEPIALSCAMNWRLRAWLTIALVLLLTSCAMLPKDVARPPSQAIAASTDTELGRIAAASTPAGTDAGASGFRLLSWAAVSLFTRVELARRAQRSLDLQYYELH